MISPRIALALLISAFCVGAAAQDNDSVQRFSMADSNANPFGPLLPRGLPVNVHGVQAVCTSPDSASLEDRRWSAYPLKLEFLAGDGALLPFAQVAVSDIKGQNVVSVRCPGSWLLLGLPPGDYLASVASPRGADQEVGFVVPREGQKSVMVRFRAPVRSGVAALGYRP